MVISEDVAAEHWIIGEELGAGGKGDHPLTVTPLPFVTKHNISLADWGNNGETGLWRSSSIFLYSSDKSAQSRNPALQGQSHKEKPKKRACDTTAAFERG